MKDYENIEEFKSSILQLLNTVDDVEVAFTRIAALYSGLVLDLPLLKPFNVELVKTKTLEYSVYYEPGLMMSKNSIVIFCKHYDAYLWTDCDGWCLDDDLYAPEEIAAHLCKAFVFENIPVNVQELKFLIDDGYWVFLDKSFPVFAGPAPEDTREVLSWDAVNILTGTRRENMEVLSRQEWKKLCDLNAFFLWSISSIDRA